MNSNNRNDLMYPPDGSIADEVALLRALMSRNQEPTTRATALQMTPNLSEVELTKSQRLAIAISNALLHQQQGLHRTGTGTRLIYPSLGCDLKSFSNQSGHSTSGACAAKQALFPKLLMTSAGQKLPVPVKIYTILSCFEFEHIVAWMPYGHAWKILDLDAFCYHVLPFFMSGTSTIHFCAFVRILNIWGFRQFTKNGPDTSAFFHESFLRGHTSLLQAMRPIASSQRRPLHEPESELDLYALEPLSFNNGVQTSACRPHMTIQSTGCASSSGATTVHFLQSATQPTCHSSPIRSESHHLAIGGAIPISHPSCFEVMRYYMAKDLIAAKELGEKTLLHLVRASHVANSGDSQEGVQSTTTPLIVGESIVFTPLVETSARNEDLSTKVGRKSRRKWLPPLGPPSTMALSKKPSPDGGTSASEWLYTSPESFASLSGYTPNSSRT